MHQNLFTFYPDNVILNYQNGEFNISQITIQNRIQSRICFKIKSTEPLMFTVKPSRGIIEVNGSVQIEIQTQIVPHDLTKYSGQKFLILCQLAENARTMAEIDDLWRGVDTKSQNVDYKKIRTIVYRLTDGKQSEVINPSLVSSVYEEKQILQPPSLINKLPDNTPNKENLDELMKNIYDLDQKILRAQFQREEAYNKLVDQQLKKNTQQNQIKILIPLFIGIMISFCASNWETILSLI